MQKIKSILLTVLLSLATTAMMAATTNPEAVTALLNRIGGSGTADRFVTIVDESLKSSGKDVFTITAQDGKPCIKGSSTLAVATGINWYLNHYAHVNLAWNHLTTDLSGVTLPVPATDETRTCHADYRYYLNYCTFSYSMSTWTWKRWQEEIDWMALHGINMPLQIVGLDVVWKRLLTEKYGYSEAEANAFVAGPCFQAWWGMNNLEGWGGPNPAWWYERQGQLAGQILGRMRELGMDPVLPGFCGMVPSNFTTKTGIKANNQGGWCGFTRPYILDPSTKAFKDMAANYYKILKEVMGTSVYYSMDPFHEGANVSGIDVDAAYAAIYETMKAANTDIDEKWVIQYWQWGGHQYKVLDKVAKGDLIVLDLFSDAHTHFGEYKGHDAVYCMLDNFGGRTGFFGRLNGIIDGYFNMKAQHSNVKGIGATPEAIEQVPVLYDALFELPWYDSKPDSQTWLADYAVARYGTDNQDAKDAWELLRNSSLNCTSGLQGPMEGVLCARPALQVGSVSSWGGTGIFYDSQDVARAAGKLLGTTLSGDNYDYDLADLSRQALTDYSYYLLQGINEARNSGNTALFNSRKEAFLQLMLDLDDLLNTHSMLQLGRWTQMARGIADEVSGTTTADKDWLELDNARTLITTWGDRNQANGGGLRDYSYRMWAGMLKDYYYPRWKYFFDNNCQGKDWFAMEWAWAHDNSKTYSDQPTGSTADVARQLFAKYFFPVTLDNGKAFYAYRTIDNDVRKTYCPTVNRGSSLDLGLTIPTGTTASFLLDLNADGVISDSETFTSLTTTIPADCATGKVKAQINLSDGTTLAFNVILKDEITTPRTVTVQTEDAAKGTATIKGGGTSVTNTDFVTIVATPAAGYDFVNWTDAAGNVVSQDAEYTYYGAEAATFTAHFIINLWGVPSSDMADYNDVKNYNQYIKTITLEQYGGDAEEIYSAEACPEQFYNVATKVISAAPGGSFTLNWTDGGGLGYTYLSAYIDLNRDGEFNMQNELLAVKGTHNSQSNDPKSGPITVTLPFDMPEGLTHIRLRFDGAWKTGYDATTGAFDAKAKMNRMCYEILVNVEKSAKKAVTVSVETSNVNHGTVDANGQPDTHTYPVGEQVILRCYPKTGYRIDYWKDQFGRRLPASWMEENVVKFYPYDNATISAVFTSTKNLTYNGWTFNYEEMGQGIYITDVMEEGTSTDLDLTQANSIGKELVGVAPQTFRGRTSLTSIALPASCLSLDRFLKTSFSGAGVQDLKLAPETTIPAGTPFHMTLAATTNGASFNEWGSSLLATGDNSFANDFTGGFQLYWAKAGTLTAKVNGSGETRFSTSASSAFTIDFDYDGSTVTLTLQADDKAAETKTFSNVALKDIATFTSSIPAGINVTSLLISDPTLHSKPFEGCTGMLAYTVEPAHPYFSSPDGNLCAKDGSQMLAYAEGKLYERAYVLTNAADNKVAASNPPADADGNLIATGSNGSERVVTTNENTTAASLVRFAKVSGKNEIYHFNSAGYFGGKSDNGGNGQQIEVLVKPEWAGDYTLNQRTPWTTGLSTSVSLGCAGFYVASSAGKFILSNTEPADGNASVWTLTEVKQLTVSVGEDLWTAVCFPVDVVVPATSEATIYKAIALKGEDKMTLTSLPEGTLIKAGEGFLVSTSAAKDVTFDISYLGTATALSDNLLSGATARRTGLTAETFYGLGNKDGVGFFLSTGTQVPANQAYLLRSRIAGSAANGLFFDFITTGISHVQTESLAGQKLYDLQGRRVLSPTRGIYVTEKGERIFIK